MRDYAKEYPDATLDEFRPSYAKLDSQRRQVHTLCSLFHTLTNTLDIQAYEARSKELKAAAKASLATSQQQW